MLLTPFLGEGPEVLIRREQKGGGVQQLQGAWLWMVGTGPLCHAVAAVPQFVNPNLVWEGIGPSETSEPSRIEVTVRTVQGWDTMEARTVLIRFSSAGIQAGAGGQGLEGPSWGVQSQHLSEETCLALFLLDLSIARWPAGIFAFCLGLLLVVSSGGSAGGCEGLPPAPQSKTPP